MFRDHVILSEAKDLIGIMVFEILQAKVLRMTG